MPAKTVHNIQEAQSLSVQPKFEGHIAFDGTQSDFFVKSEWLNCGEAWLFGAHLQASQVNPVVQYINLYGITVETAKLVTKQIFPNLKEVYIFDIKIQFDSIIEQVLIGKGFNVVRRQWQDLQGCAVHPNYVGTNTTDHQNFLAFVNMCMTGWRPDAEIRTLNTLNETLQELKEEIQSLHQKNEGLTAKIAQLEVNIVTKITQFERNMDEKYNIANQLIANQTNTMHNSDTHFVNFIHQLFEDQ